MTTLRSNTLCILWDVHTIEELTKRNFEKTGEGHDDESDIDEQV